MANKLIVYGGGGFGMEVLSYLEDIKAQNAAAEQKFEIVGIIDSSSPRMEDARTISGKRLTHWTHENEVEFDDDTAVVIAVGDPLVRAKLKCGLDLVGARLFTLIHPTAYVAPTATIEDGVILCPFSFVGPFATLDCNVVLNTYASVGHDASVGASSVLCPYAALNGHSACGEESFLGSQSVIVVRTRMGSISKLSAGSILYADTEDGVLAAGNPARARVMYKREE